MTHGTDGKVYDRIAMTWVEPAEMARRHADRQEMAFRMKPNQGELACPMIILDTMKPTQSMLDGKYYDSKSNLRRTYRQGGVEEVGNDPAYTDPERVRPKQRPKPDRKAISCRSAWRRAISAGSTHVMAIRS